MNGKKHRGSRSTRKAARIAARRVSVAQLYLAGFSIVQIASKLGVSHPTISRDIQALKTEWQQEAAKDYDKAIGQMLASLDLIEQEAWVAWERSKRDHVVQADTVKDLMNKEGQHVGTAITRKTKRETKHGNPSHLAIILQCIRTRCEIFGINRK
jgi:transposase